MKWDKQSKAPPEKRPKAKKKKNLKKPRSHKNIKQKREGQEINNNKKPHREIWEKRILRGNTTKRAYY